MIKVNGKEIPQDAVNFELQRLMQFHAEHGVPEEKIRAELPVLKKRAEQQAIGASLLFDEAARLEIDVSEDEIDARIAEMTEQAGGEERFAALLKKKGVNIVEFRGRIKRGKRVDKLVEKAVAGLPEPGEDEIRGHYEAHKDEYTKEAQVCAQHILVTPKEGVPDAKLQAIGKLNEIRSRIATGADFAIEASAHSDCPSGKQAGGSLGWFSKGMMVKEFDEKVFAMPVGGLSEIIETQFGFHIIYKSDEEPAGTPDFDEVHDRIADFLRHTKRGEALEAFVDSLRDKAEIQIS